jgi:hypothetical protein
MYEVTYQRSVAIAAVLVINYGLEKDVLIADVVGGRA